MQESTGACADDRRTARTGLSICEGVKGKSARGKARLMSYKKTFILSYFSNGKNSGELGEKHSLWLSQKNCKGVGRAEEVGFQK